MCSAIDSYLLLVMNTRSELYIKERLMIEILIGEVCAPIEIHRKQCRIKLEWRYFWNHDNAKPHCSQQSAQTVRNQKISCDTLPVQTWFGMRGLLAYPKLNEMLKGQHFSCDTEVELVCNWIKCKPKTFFLDGMKKNFRKK